MGVMTSTGCPVLHGFDPHDQAQVENPGPIMKKAREEMPVFYSEKYDYYVVTRYQDALAVLNDAESFSNKGSSNLPPPPAEVAPLLPNGYSLLWSFGTEDPPEHTRSRRLTRSAYSVRQAQAIEDYTRRLAHVLIDEFVQDGRVNLATEFCQKLPVRVVCALLGTPEEDIPQLYQWAIELLTLFGNQSLSDEDRVRLSLGQVDFEAYLQRLIDSRRDVAQAEGSFIDKLLVGDGEGERLSDQRILGTVTSAVFAGSDTAAGTIGHTVNALLQDRSRWEEVLGDRSLIPAAIDETMRQDYIARMQVRTATRDVEIGGVPIPAGASVMVHFWSTGHDETVFSDPETWDLHRPNRNRHLGFGGGPHICAGIHIAKMEMRVAINALMDRIPSARLAQGSAMTHANSALIPGLVSGPIIEWDAA